MKLLRLLLTTLSLIILSVAAQAQSLGSVTTSGGSWTLDLAPDINDDFTKIYATPVLTIGNQTIWGNDRAIAVSGCISGTDAGAGSSYTIGITSACIDAALLATDSVSADELNATGVESELEAVLDLADLQGSLTLAGDVDGSHGSNDLDEVAVESELESVLDLADLQGSLTLAGDVDGAHGSNDLDEAAVESELESVLDVADLQGYSAVLTEVEAAAAYQPLDADLTSIAGLTTTSVGRSILTVSDPNVDRLPFFDDSAGTIKLGVIADFTSEGAPAAGDKVFIQRAGTDDLAIVDWSDLPGASGGVDNFLDLTDTPDAYTGAAGDCVVVNGTEDGLEFTACSGGAGDDLGDHTATEDLKMTTFDIDFGTGDVKIDYSANTLAFTGATSDYSFDDTVNVTGSVVASVDVTATAGDVTSGDDVIVGDDIVLASGAVINWNASDLTLTHSANTLTLAGGTLVVPDTGLTVGASTPFSDSAGTLTLQNVDALDATTEATIEAALDTLANVTSIGGDVTAGGDFISTDDLISGDDILLSDGGVINFNAGDCTLTEGTNTLTIAGTCTLVTEVVTPDGDNTRDLGSAAATWATAHINAIELANGTANTLTATGGDLSIEGNALYRAGGTDVAVADGGTGQSTLNDLITLSTHTTGSYVQQVADGTGIDGSVNTEGGTYTPTLDLTEINTFTLGAGAATGIIFDAGATDPAIETASGSMTIDIGGTNELVIDASNLTPGANDGNALGATGTRWADLFLADGGVIDLGASGSRATITHVAASDSITISADPDNATASTSINLAVDNTTEATLNSTNFSPGANDGNALGVSGTAWADLFLASGGLIEFDGGTTNSLTCTGGNCTIEGNGLYRAGGTDVAVADGGTGQSTLNDLITLSTHTTGSYVQQVADGTGIDGTANAEGATYTPTLDLTELSTATWGAGAFTTMTFDAGATDPVFTFGSGTLSITNAAITVTSQPLTADDLTSVDDVIVGDDLTFASGGVINWNAGDLTLTHSANTLTLTGGSLVLDATGLTVGASVPFSDSAGTLTLQNVDAVDATTESTIEAAIDTLANLTSIQGRTVTLTDENLDVLMGWDDSDGAYESLSLAEIGTEGAPASGDFLLMYGAEGDLRKVDWASLPGAAGGDSVTINSAGIVDPDFNDSTPAAGSSGVNVTWQVSGANVSAYIGASTDTTKGVVELATTAEADTGTDTSRAVTAAGVKAAGSGKKPIALLAGAGTLPSGGGIAACTMVTAFDSGSNDVFLKQCSFSASTDNAIYWTIPAPKSSDESVDWTLRIDWTSATTTDATDDVIWTAAAVCWSNDDPINGNAFPTVDTVTDTQTAAGDFLSTSEITAITPAGTWAEGDVCVLRVTRDADAGGDNFNGTAELINAMLYITSNALTDD